MCKRILFIDVFCIGGEDVSAMCQTLDYSGSTVNDDNTSVTSSNIHAELLGSSKKGQSIPGSSDSEHGISYNMPLDKEKRKQDKERVCLYSAM